ncbi:MAG TPA: hypothetical protein VF484_01165, partial [Candidatus Limnocylindrales bacterium]
MTSGLSLAYRTTSELRRASLYIGLLTLAILGPPIVVVIELVAKLRLTDLSAIASLGDDPSAALLFSGVLLLVYVALACWITVAVDGHLIAIALLAAKASGRPYSIRDATVRARQVFWRQVRGAIVAGVFVIVVELIVLAALTQVARDNSANGFVAGVIATLIAAPLGYLSTGIVLGDVGAIEALKRSIRLARARPRTAIVVALFAVITSAIQTFALGAGLELLVDAGNALHVDLASSVVPLTITILVVLAFVMAFGSLTFTISAIVAAPQVAAFLGLTFYSAGLDRALVTSPSDRKFRWVTRPMIALIVVTAMISGFALTSVGAVQPLAREPLLELLFNQAPGHAAVLGQPHRHQSDPAGDESGPPDPSVDITDAEYAYLPVVPDFLLDGLFKCGGTHVACDPDTSLRQTFASGAMLVLVQLSAPYPAVASGRVSSWAMVFDRPDLLPVSGNEEFPGNFIVVTEIRNGALRIYSRAVTQGLGSTQSTPTPARSAWVGSALATIIPISTITMPSEWNVVADVGPPGAPATSDRIASNAFD